MPNTKEKRKRFNFIDVILLVIILAVISAMVYVGFKAYDNYFLKEASGTSIRYQILVEGVSDEIKYEINKNDTVVDSESLTSIGKVVSYYVEPSTFVGTDQNGNTVESDHPNKSDILIVVDVKATGIGGVYDINGYSVTVGKDISFRIPGLSAEGKCVSLEVRQ